MDCIYIHGFGIGEYRSFGPELQRIGPCKKINLFIGQNNCGKSNVLRFLAEHYGKLHKLFTDTPWQWKDLEFFLGSKESSIQVSAAIVPNMEWTRGWRGELVKYGIEPHLDRLISVFDSVSDNGLLWVNAEFPRTGGQTALQASTLNEWRAHGFEESINRLANQLGATARRPDILLKLIQHSFQEVTVKTIPAIRKAGDVKGSESDLSGSNIVERIAKIEQPDHTSAAQAKKEYMRIVNFLREVTGKPDAMIRVPFDRKTINVEMDGRLLPLDALGTGISEVIILAATATTHHGHVICIEEPEIHLHPLLQKKLLRYLQEQTDNQYFITTHSAHLLDHPGAAIFHVQLTDKGSKVAPATQASDKFAICQDLGYHASDLLQTNCIIWVEGPSDRVYIREWIRLHDPKLTEGIEYSIMFYGGRLLSHLTPDDPEVTEFINLRRLNRNMVVVMDSDRSTSRTPINKTKKRIIETWKHEPGFAWLTKGREIENYVSPTAIKEALAAIAPKKKHPALKNDFSQCIGRDANGAPLADKVKVSHWLAENGKLALDVLDLRNHICRLSDFIRTSNQLEVLPPLPKAKRPKRK